MQKSQRFEGHNSLQENRDSQLRNLNQAAERAPDASNMRAREGLQKSSLDARLNNQPRSVADLMKDPQGRMAVNNALVQLGAPSFQNRVDWIAQNPALAGQALQMAKQMVPHLSGGINATRVNHAPNGAHVDARQVNAQAYGHGASNSAGQIGGY